VPRGAWTIAWLSITVLFSAVPSGATHVDPSEIVYVLAPDAIPAITEPQLTTDDRWLSPSDPVVGVAVGGDARAYPIRILNWHEVVNDWVDGRAVAVTFCPLCGTGIAYDRSANGQQLVFKVSGKLYKNDLVMYDTGTGSLWSQLLGEAIQGPLHGSRLSLVSSATMAWSDWKLLHPETRLLARPRVADGSFQRNYDVDPYEGYALSTAVWFPQGNVDTTSGLHPKEYILGVVLNGVAKAYPYRFLSVERVVNDAVGGEPIVVTFSRDTARAFSRPSGNFTFVDEATMRDEDGITHDLLTGRALGGGQDLVPVAAKESFWFAWFDFYPDTEVYRVGRVAGKRPAPSPSLPLFLAVAAGAMGSFIAVVEIARRIARRKVLGAKVNPPPARNRR